jgi:hypothetical protein
LKQQPESLVLLPEEIAGRLLAEHPHWHGWVLRLRTPIVLGRISSNDGLAWRAYDGPTPADSNYIGTWGTEKEAKQAVEAANRQKGWNL